MRKPNGMKEHPTMGYLICKHRDVSCCPACADSRKEIVDVLGQHFWIADPIERFQMIKDCAELLAKEKAGQS